MDKWVGGRLDGRVTVNNLLISVLPRRVILHTFGWLLHFACLSSAPLSSDMHTGRYKTASRRFDWCFNVPRLAGGNDK